LIDSSALESHKSNVRDTIQSELHFSTVSGKIENLVKDYINTRCSVWIKGVINFTTDKSQELILSSYKQAISEFEAWISGHQVSADLDGSQNSETQISLKTLLGLEFPSGANPEIDLKLFDESFRTWAGKIASSAFSPDWLSNFVAWLSETGAEASYQLRRFGNWLFNKSKETEKKPSFNRDKAFQSAKEKINAFFSRQAFKNIYELGKNPDLLRPQSYSATSSPQDLVSWVSVIEQQIEINDQAMLLDKCSEFLRLWQAGQDSVKLAICKSFTNWGRSVQKTLTERYDRLSSEAISLIEQSNLQKIEILIHEIRCIIPENDREFRGDFLKVIRLIADRKVEEDKVI
jgi:hypothetical protein